MKNWRKAQLPVTTETLTPYDLGLPNKFQDWRGTQAEAIESIAKLIRTRNGDRFLAQAQPTGSGKSLTYVAASLWADAGRTIVLTSTKALQTQLMKDFKPVGMVEIKGKNTYSCRIDRKRRADKAPCSFGQRCKYAIGGTPGCDYYDALRTAKGSQLVVTNYAYWITTRLHRDPGKVEEGLQRPHFLVLDEAHAAPDHLTDALTFKLTAREVGEMIGMQLPDSTGAVPGWVAQALHYAETRYGELVPEVRDSLPAADEVARYRDLINKLNWLDRSGRESGDWMVNITCGEAGYSPVWPRRYAEKYMFDQSPKVLFISATVRPKTVEMLGLRPRISGGMVSPTVRGEVLRSQIEDKSAGPACEFEEWPSTFPVENRLLYHVPTIRLSHRTGPEDLRLWLARIDQIIRPRLDRKGIIHTVSYERRDLVKERSDYRGYMMVHKREDLARVVDQFRKSDPPCILVSPSVVTGHDFPDDECRWQIIGKIGFPDMRDPILRERTKQDPDYVHYLAMQSLVQACGRGTRSEKDWCENFIIDDNVKWFLHRYGHFAPDWFREAFRKVDFVPQGRR